MKPEYEQNETLNEAFGLGSHKATFYKKMVAIAVPVVIQNLISIGLNMIDILMVGWLGEKPLAAVGSANQIFFIFAMICFGFYSGSGVYVAQFFGIQDIKSIRKVLGIDYLVGFVAGCFVGIVCFLFAPKLIWIFSRDTEVISLGADYMRMVCFSYVMTAISFAIVYNSRAIQRLTAVTTINALAIIFKTFLSYCLIYGKLGFPEMGVKGAALGTLIARSCELVALLIYVYSQPDHPFHGKFADFFSFNKAFFRQVMDKAMPVVFTEGGWALTVALTFVAYGMLGPSALAVIQVAEVVVDLTQAVYFGLGNATAVIIGEALGRGDRQSAYAFAVMSQKITWILNGVVTLFIIAISKPVSVIYHFSPETTKLLVYVMIAWAFTVTPKMLAYILICGILRAGGDTVYCLKVDLSCNMLIQVPLAFFGVLVLHLPLYFVVVLICLSDVLKSILCIRRVTSKKWMNIVTGREALN